MHSIQVSHITVSTANSTEPSVFLLVCQCQTVIDNYTAPKSLPTQGYIQCTCYLTLWTQKDNPFLVSFKISNENCNKELPYSLEDLRM